MNNVKLIHVQKTLSEKNKIRIHATCKVGEDDPIEHHDDEGKRPQEDSW